LLLLTNSVQSLAVVKLVQALSVGMLFGGHLSILQGSLHDELPPAQDLKVGQFVKQVGFGVGLGPLSGADCTVMTILL
jgi:hypothetical protein